MNSRNSTMWILMAAMGWQAAAVASDAATTSSAQLEEIMVTARKRAGGETLQQTPISATVFGADQFKAVFAQDLEDLGRLSPSVQMKSSSQVGVQNFTIRGMGVSGTTPSDEPTVGIIKDGIFWASNYGANLDMFDVESVQILRGPQRCLGTMRLVALSWSALPAPEENFIPMPK